MAARKIKDPRQDAELGLDVIVKKLIIRGKRQGFLLCDEINEALPADASDKVEAIINTISGSGIKVIEDQSEIDSGDQAKEVSSGEVLGENDDPVHMYLKSMGGVELLTREGEIEIAKRIEDGRKKMIYSLCSSPLAMREFITLYDDIVNEEKLLRDIIAKFGFTTPILAKIEKWEAVKNLDGIIESFDAVMVARGDLGVEMPIEQVPLIQKEVIEKANSKGKPVIIATQILDSMVDRPVPTRAEVSDIANAILDGADSLMVTGETAIGKHPTKVIKVLSKVINKTELSIDYGQYSKWSTNKEINTANAISHAACAVSRSQRIGVLATMTHSGYTARMAARYRPASKIIALTPFKKTCRKLAIVWGVSPALVRDYKSADEIPEVANEELQKLGLIKKGESFVVTGGVPVGISGTTNYLTVLTGT